MATVAVTQIIVMMLFFSTCHAQDGCVAYGFNPFTSYTVTVGSQKDCFSACVEAAKCYHYSYNGNCTITVLAVPIDTSADKWSSGTVICSNDMSHCSAYLSFKAASPLSTNHAGCFQSCSNNPKCLGYSYNSGSCTTRILQGNAIDINSTQNTEAMVRCKIPEPTTTTHETTTQETTTQETTTQETTTKETTTKETTTKETTTQETTTQETTTQDTTTPPATTIKATRKRCRKV
ncbi:uncharacterized protein LOC131956467 [Physella acuta]|uniref:uncharacterized protein LOC131956467 n=1 Tax=Physella acuta TaxID=109671 RepID=UPI0027DC31FC|nr:uncharacterized protein LOC131956467 [Physella acuta]